jgi:hypothetical protein
MGDSFISAACYFLHCRLLIFWQADLYQAKGHALGLGPHGWDILRAHPHAILESVGSALRPGFLLETPAFQRS